MRDPDVPRRLHRGQQPTHPLVHPRAHRRLAALLAAVALGACGSDQDPTLPAAQSTTATSSTTATTAATTTSATTVPAPTLPAAAPGTCPPVPAARALDPRRPRYEVAATVDVPAGILEGTTTIAFTPDSATDVVVLRLWANGPRPARAGARIEVGAVTDASTAAPLATSQPDPTTLVVTPSRPLAAGDTVTIAVPFRLRVTGSVNDRISHSGDTLRLGSAFPLLAWEPGVGWATDPPTSGFAESATSPAADWALRLDVTEGYGVLATGAPDAAGVWRATGARDVGVSVGRFAAQASSVVGAPHPVQVTVGVDSSVGDEPAAYLARVEAALADFAARFGPYPFDSYTLAITPGLSGGIEFPGHVMQGPDTIGRTTPHEVGHQWFYALVGNDQGRDPWLDEGLASYAELRHEGTVAAAAGRSIPADAAGRAGEPMTYWETRQDSYYRGVYVQPAVAVAGLGEPGLVDCALRLYVAANAWGIARPADLLDALGVVFPDAEARLAAVGIAR